MSMDVLSPITGRVDAGRFSLHVPDVTSTRDDFAGDVLRGLTSTPRYLLPQYFYDDLGSALFEAICHLPEYYPTRCETEILQSFATEIVHAFGPSVRIVELGSGSARKTRHLLAALLQQQRHLTYIPVDIDPGVLVTSARELLGEQPRLEIAAIASDYRDPDAALRPLLPPARPGERTIVLFLGSSIGNLASAEAGAMLSSLRRLLTPGDALLLGADLVKPRQLLEPAYDDALGVTAAFNRNLLSRINRELGGDFDLSSFAHRAFFNEVAARVEMHLVSTRAQSVRIAALDVTIDFAEGESIHTENSHKYDERSIAALAHGSGFTPERRWTDANGWFCDVLLRAASQD
jgi:dimethylhistidine N-methyltransferase